MRSFVLVGVIAGLLFVFLTPPFQVPDEVGHYWRAVAIAEGYVLPTPGGAGSFAAIPEGMRTLVFVFYRDIAGKPEMKITREQFRTAWYLPLRAGEKVEVKLPAAYTPVAYAPQVLAAGAGRLLGLRPVITFYLGRLLNLLAFVALTATAVRVAPRLKSFFAASALLPMALFLAGSWSPDAMTIASAHLFLALLLRGMPGRGETAAAALTGAIVGLCKPAYFLIAFLGFTTAKKRRLAAVLVLLATFAGVAIALVNASRAQEYGAVAGVSPGEQLRLARRDPLRVAGIVAADVRTRGLEYGEQMIGRLGMLEIRLPGWVLWIVFGVLVLCSLTAGGEIAIPARVLALAIFVTIAGGIFLATYLSWTKVGAATVEGIQGRYFLPALPLLGVTFAASIARLARIVPPLIIGAAAFWNGAALMVMVLRFY